MVLIREETMAHLNAIGELSVNFEGKIEEKFDVVAISEIRCKSKRN